MTLQKNRTALITGASRGLGLALARQLAERGWNLIVDARSAEALKAAQKELAPRTFITAIAGDVADPAHRRALTVAARAAGGLDAVVNNAGILGPSPQPELLDYPLDVLEQVYRVNVLAPLALLQAVRSELKPEARIINITSDAGVEAYPGWGGYGSSKAALEQLSAILAAENPQWRVYWVDPGDMRTPMHQDAFPGEDISDRPLPEESVPGLIELIEGDYPSGRYKARELPSTNTPGGVQEGQMALTVEAIIQQYPGQIYRIDKFKVPKPARAEFIQRVRIPHEFIKTQPGFIQDFVFEQIGGPGAFNFVTVAVWESADALDAARQAATAKYREIGFKPNEIFDRLGIVADMANYSPIET
ncbi:MAG: SDR family NAD(P)-dependent oxidoreductase [Chloroflexi bacterium]|nr:SDR family NAD(P)-dependent oxidoreductase [Chloroflexota bacterium]